MEEEKYDLGLVGLGVMGRNLVLNFASHGYSVIGLDNNKEKAEALNDEGRDYSVTGTTDMKKFITGLSKPRKIMMLIPAGDAVDSVIEELKPFLQEGDLIIDGGNSHFRDTQKRFETLGEEKIEFMGVGISGGARGARNGPSIMPGGTQNAYEKIRPIFEKAAAKVNGEPCVTFVGQGTAGHYVKMVHNGIEYALMQLISESYDLLREGLQLNNMKLHEVYSAWNEGNAGSYLLEITSDIFLKKDPKDKGQLIDHILDESKQKGTGKWTSQDAMDLQVPVPSIDVAVMMRNLSTLKDERVELDQEYGFEKSQLDISAETFINDLQEAFYFSMLVIFAQGMHLLRAATNQYHFDLDLSEIAKIWRGGCIIRAKLLERIRQAYQENEALPHLLYDDYFKKTLLRSEQSVRNVVTEALISRIPVPGFQAAIAYFDAMRSEYLPSNLIQAQRDYFGSHTYERTDREGTFHTQWNR